MILFFFDLLSWFWSWVFIGWEGISGRSVCTAAAIARWEQPRFCVWSCDALLRWFWEASQWFGQGPVSNHSSFFKFLFLFHIFLMFCLWSFYRCYLKTKKKWLFLSSWIFILLAKRDQQTVDFKKVDAHVHQLKGSSSRYFSPSNRSFVPLVEP